MDAHKNRLIEETFPFDELSLVAKQESWRKEIHRPLSYIHKWWARRLGSVFRALIIGGIEEQNSSLFERYYSDVQYADKVVFDPFMGSGTTITEAVKLGAKVIGSDINPVAATMVRAALENYSTDEVVETYEKIERKYKDKIAAYYKTSFNGHEADVLYYFWVCIVKCDDCDYDIPFRRSSIFSKNAYPSKKPVAQSVCPDCGGINEIHYLDERTRCGHCHTTYNPQKGNVEGADYLCPACGKRERIIDYIRRTEQILPRKMYAKMILDPAGNKRYLPIDDQDLKLYSDAERELKNYQSFIPQDSIKMGINTNQIINYQFKRWKDMFNSRQLLSCGILTKAVNEIEDLALRRLFAVLVSGTLEFNNMFCSFKGEGTGAVRPLFHNHILRNELTPLEANLWGVNRSSGGFSTFFETRIRRALEYKEKPFEIKFEKDGRSNRYYLRKCTIKTTTTDNLSSWENNSPLILCQDSANTGLPSQSVDLVVTDPPFFDNVNYSELADFFFVWLKKLNIGIERYSMDSTRAPGEVQDDDPVMFEKKLCAVFSECNRVLKDEGLLIFTYHHSKMDGWVSVFNAISGSGFRITQVFPVKAEMSVSVSISAAKMPINYDLVFVCRKVSSDALGEACTLKDRTNEINDTLLRMSGKKLSFLDGDEMVLLYGHALKHLSSNGVTKVTSDDVEATVRAIFSAGVTVQKQTKDGIQNPSS